MPLNFEVNESDYQDTRASLELLYEISREIAAASDLQAILKRVLFLSTKNIGAISRSIIVLDGGGYKAGAEAWLRNQTDDVLLHIFNSF